ncbi:Alcohol dehydrogenase, class IV [Anaerocolumna jejuensis DSM 15929]|uniref:Alcohol dehydrogenase, class IV n=1 Tax=Anaerocolumna jejuensis DSM 15929 TaxID=1121322 RepID=A0A1M6Q1X5_9FIRM|nr:iron-containing alcohol dehydrogenase [Anaerocolumna jejuensis]SHK14235.1 Alcohol dehydrogenase, class IV [Anaerocolumna jejuensis DSM 15929]
MNNFTYFIPTRILFGAGQLAHLHEQQLPGKKALIVISSGRSMKDGGYLSRVEEQLDLAGVGSVLFDQIKPNPTLKNVMDGAAMAKENGCDFVVGLGGGSSMDAAKAIAFAAINPGYLWEYSFSMTGGKKTPVNAPLPIVAVTTTAGTGSEVDPWAVITKEETEEKSGFGFESMYPALSIVDSDLMMTVPPILTAYQGMDAFFHASESVINTKNHPMGEMFALKTIELLAACLPGAVKDGSDKEARAHVALANTLAGYYMLCTSAHSMEHAMSGFYPNLPHGAGLIMIAHAYYQHFADLHVCDGQMIKMAKAMGVENAVSGQEFVDALDKLLADCNVEALKMSEYGITPESLKKFPERARKVLGGDFSADPAVLTDNDILSIYQKSFR